MLLNLLAFEPILHFLSQKCRDLRWMILRPVRDEQTITGVAWDMRYSDLANCVEQASGVLRAGTLLKGMAGQSLQPLCLGAN